MAVGYAKAKDSQTLGLAPTTKRTYARIFFETGLPHATFAAALLKEGVAIGRGFPPYDRWARISIGLPEENVIARAAVGKTLSKLPA